MAKVMISLPDDLLTRLDSEAKRRQTSRSAVLQAAVLRELGRPDPEALDAALRRSRSRFAGAGSFDSTKLIRAERDARSARRRM